MIGLSRNLSHSSTLANRRTAVIDATKKLFEDYPDGTFTGRGNSKADVTERIKLFDGMLRSIAGE
jgi:hypothetical protein